MFSVASGTGQGREAIAWCYQEKWLRDRNSRFPSLALAIFLFAGCAGQPQHRVEFDGGIPVQNCPDDLKGLVSVSAESLPIAMPDGLARDGVARTDGELARRVVLSVTTSGALRSDRITWTGLSLSTFGGTFVGWSSLQTSRTVVNALKPATQGALSPTAKGESAETASVTFSPGEIKVIRAARDNADLSGTSALDVVVMPGGVEVDSTVLRVSQLWTTDGTPLPAEAVKFELVPVRHPPGKDVVDAALDLAFIVQRGRAGDEWSCSAEGRVTLVDQEAVRQPLWDIGIAESNGRRTSWLALSDTAAGVIRLIFDSPAAATAFASWVQMSRANRIGHYTVGLFDPPASTTRRSFAPLEGTAMRTFRPIAADDFVALKIGALGER